MPGSDESLTVIPDTTPGEAAMSTAEGRGSHASGAVQQAPGLWRTDLQRQDLSVPGREVVQSRVDIGPEAPLVKHTHPGEEIIYVLEGSLEYQIGGQPPKTFSAGDALTVPARGDPRGEECLQRQRGRTRHVCRREREAAPHAGRVSASPTGPAVRGRQPIQEVETYVERN
jgi:quercetin dioxygenase-like cupin family protein